MFLRHTFIYFLSKGLPGIVSFLAILIYTRFLTPEEYGRYSLIISTVGILNIIFLQWFKFGVARFYPEYIEQKKQHVFLYFVRKNLFIFLQCVTLSIILFSGVTLLFLNSDRAIIYALIGLILLFQSTFDIFMQLFISELRPNLFSIANIAKSVITVSLGSFLLWKGFSYEAIIIGLLIGIGIAIIFSWRHLGLKQNEIIEYDKSLLKNILTYSLPLIVSSCMSFVLTSSNRFVIQYYWGDTETGFFILGSDFADQTLGVLLAIVSTASFPIAMRIYAAEGKSIKFNEQMKNALLLLLGIALPAVVVFLTSYNDIINLFFGLKFRSVNPILIPIVAISTFMLGVKSYFLDQVFYFKRETRYQTFILIGTALLNFILNLVFVPKYGYIACAYVSLFSFLLATVATAIVVHKIMPLPIPIVSVLKILFAASMMFFFLFTQPSAEGLLHLFVKITFGLLIYFTVAAILEFTLVKKILIRFQQSSKKI